MFFDFFLVVSLMLVVVWIVYWAYRFLRRSYLQKIVDQHKLPWMHSVYEGTLCWHRVQGTEYKFYADAPYSIVVTLDSVPVGIVGFSLKVSTHDVYIVQLQGFKGANFKGNSVGTYLLSCAEQFFCSLGRADIFVLAARYNDYWPDDSNLLSLKELAIRKVRLERTYDFVPKVRGYVQLPHQKWWYKKLSEG